MASGDAKSLGGIRICRGDRDMRPVSLYRYI